MRNLFPALLAGLAVAIQAGGAHGLAMVDFESDAPVQRTVTGGRARLVSGPGDNGTLLRVRCLDDRKTAVTFTNLPAAAAELACRGGVAFDVENPGGAPLTVAVSIEGKAEDGSRQRRRHTASLAPGALASFPVWVFNAGAGPYWGMQGIPVYGPIAYTMGPSGGGRTLTRVTALRVEAVEPPPGATFHVHGATAFAPDSPLSRVVSHPYVDAFGQYMHQDWAYKVRSAEDMERLDAEESERLEEAPLLPGRDAYGGWADGPQLEATGAFRTEKVGGKWWLVTPDGRLFLSIGVNCVWRGEETFVTGREDAFAWLPEPGSPLARFMGERSGVHSRAEPIGGTGRTVNFHAMNLHRKYGDAMEERSRERAYARLRSWGFNTIGNWSNADMLEHSTVPFTVTGYSGGARAIEGSEGYWGKMRDVFDPEFVSRTQDAVRSFSERYRDNLMLAGYFVDNELSWGGLAEGVLRSPADQPAREVFVDMLREKHGDLAGMNAAWGTAAYSWETLRLPRRPSGEALADAEAFEYRFASHYFATIAGALREFSPGKLYLGCRFTPMYMPPAVLRACAEHADVVSINAYFEQIRPGMLVELDKPVIIGEFHFGARDRGMFHTGLAPAASQAERAAKYAGYIESIAANPVFVGCHWFQYADQPVTGRTLDGENFNIGLVNVCDVPYPEMVQAARDVHARIYRERFGARP